MLTLSKRIMHYLIITILFIFIAQQQAFAVNVQEMKPQKPSLKILSTKSDDKLVVQYSVPVRAFVELKINDFIGPKVVPVYEMLDAGRYTLELDKSTWPRGAYRVFLTLHGDKKLRARKQFVQHAPGFELKNSKELENLRTQALANIGLNPQKSAEVYDELLQHTDYVNREQALLYAIMPNQRLDDSLKVHALIDSIVSAAPRSRVYSNIARFTSGLEAGPGEPVYPLTALKYAQMSLDAIGDVPVPYRNQEQVRYREVLGHSYLAAGNLEAAEKIFDQAYKTLKRDTPQNAQSRKSTELGLLHALGLVSEHLKKYDHALEFYTKALGLGAGKEIDLWISLQRVYRLKHGSSEGYLAFRQNLEATLPASPNNNQPRHSIVGTALPPFSLMTDGGKRFESVDLKNSVTILNFWSYWCGPCKHEMPMLQKLADDFAGQPVSVVGIHHHLDGLPGEKQTHLDNVRRVQSKLKVAYLQVYDTPQEDIWRKVGITTFPSTLVIDQNGIVRHVENGYDPDLSQRRLTKAIEDVLRDKKL